MEQTKVEESNEVEHDCNSDMQELHCRICLQSDKPLLAICQCSGSIEYVHEECVVDWIAHQLQGSEELEIPRCQICKSEYSARLIVGTREISFDLFFQKLEELPLKELFISFLYVVGSSIALWILLVTLYTQTLLWTESVKMNVFNSMFLDAKTFFTQGIFPWFFLRTAYRYFRKRQYLWNQSYVQIVQLVLQPKAILKEQEEEE